MTWYPIAFLPPQLEKDGIPYSGAVLKCYDAGTSTPIPMATDYLGVTTTSSFPLNADGYPNYQGTIIIPHIQQTYKIALYPDQASADANSGAVWTIDNNQISSGTNEPFIQYFDGDGVTGTFTLSESFGTDTRLLMVFSDRAITNYTSNTDFATDTIWSRGAGWTIGAGVATAAGAISTAISQNAVTPLVQGQSYTVEFTVTASAGTLTPSVGGNAGTTRGAGTWRETIIAGATQVIAFTGVGFTGTLDNASVKGTGTSRRMINRPDEMTLANNLLTLTNIPPAGTKNVIVFAPSLLIGAANASAEAAAISEANALTYSINAASAAAGLAGTSTTSLTIGSGSFSLTTQAGKQFSVGSWLIMASASNTSNYMSGQVTAYNSSTGAMTIFVPASSNYYGGFGVTASDWVIQVCGVAGAVGGIGSGTADMKSQTFVAGSGFTAGTTTQLTLTNTPLPASASALFIAFDGVIQHPSKWSLNVSTNIITFTAAIPVGVSEVYCYWFKDIAVGTPTDGTVTPPKIATGYGLVPSGAVLGFAMSTVPTGWLECTGAAVSRTTYASLFAAIGTMYGAGDGSTTFNIPDYLGVFFRVWDHGRGADPDAASRTNRGDGTTGDNVGTRQADAFKSHTHTYNAFNGGGLAASASGTAGSGTSPTSSTGGNETRPRNVNIMCCIKT